MFAEGELDWHSNESGNLTFTPGVALMSNSGMVGSATGFLTTPDYYESVSDSFRSELDEMVVLHRFTPGKMNPGLREDQDFIMYKNMCPEDDVRIPMVIQSPGGHKGLHYSINTMHSIEGMSVEESQKVFEKINKELFVDKYIYDHWYKGDHDLCLFDNSITLHHRLGGIAKRMAYRVQHDYNYLQDKPYVPYFQDEFKEPYITEMMDHLDTLNIKDYFNDFQQYMD
jgi:alpha-ketoglutarate-dependent taurine dioxygenase